MLKPNSLLLYRNRPARLLQAGDRLEIEVEGGQPVRVRPKDVTLLHPGPLGSLRELTQQKGEVQEAWELLAGERVTLPELAELIYGRYTPATAWATWQQVVDGLYFEGLPDAIQARAAEEVARKQQERAQHEQSQRAWQEFLERVTRKQWSLEARAEADREFIRDVENLALGRSLHSKVLKALNRAETPENAHGLLLELGVWGPEVNPYATRLGTPTRQPDLAVPPLPEESRRNLTTIAAFAIDDSISSTPDDAVSIEPLPNGARIWVHVADAAAIITPDSPLDLEARARGESLHLPEGTVHMVPGDALLKLAMGLGEESPALSFGMELDADGHLTGFDAAISWVRVTRLTYAEAEERMAEPPFALLEQFLGEARARRKGAGALLLDFPEVKIDVEEGRPEIHILPALRSRAMVEEAMILAGMATARFAQENGIRLAYNLQDPPESAEIPTSLSEMFAMRRLLKRSRRSTSPGPHSGLGAAAYTQVTSPLRRYLDLVGHQQLRAYLLGEPMLDESALMERIGALEAVIAPLRQAEYLSERHWTLVYLLQNPDWTGEGILVDKRGSLGTVIIPALALETRLTLPRDLALDETVRLKLAGVDLPQREARFRVVG